MPSSERPANMPLRKSRWHMKDSCTLPVGGGAGMLCLLHACRVHAVHFSGKSVVRKQPSQPHTGCGPGNTAATIGSCLSGAHPRQHACSRPAHLPNPLRCRTTCSPHILAEASTRRTNRPPTLRSPARVFEWGACSAGCAHIAEP